jgi:hypothetical protein
MSYWEWEIGNGGSGIGHRALIIYYWLLVIDYWLLVIGGRASGYVFPGSAWDKD